MFYFDPCTSQSDMEVQMIIYLQNLVNQLQYVFTTITKVAKLHILAMATPTQINVSKGYLANESKLCLNHGRLVRSKMQFPE